MSKKIVSNVVYEAKEAKIVKLKPIKENEATNFTSKIMKINKPNRTNVFDSSVSSVNSTEKSFDSLDNDPNFDTDSNSEPAIQYLTRLYVIKDYMPELMFGDLMVKKGQMVYLLADSNGHCLVMNDSGDQGFVPKEICLDLEETMRKAQQKNHITSCKVTSL